MEGAEGTVSDYNVLIVITAKDFLRLQANYHRLVRNMPVGSLIFIGGSQVGELTEAANLGERVRFINENDILPFDKVHETMKDALQVKELPRGITGWYYQQFLKMQYSAFCEEEYYMVWDGDTIPCRTIQMFRQQDNVPYLDMKSEYHEEYFQTLGALFPGMGKCIKKSFIAEHMLICRDIMKELIGEIMQNPSLQGNTFYERIIRCIDREKLTENSFSEFETYGTYVCYRHPDVYRLRSWHSLRYGGCFFDPDTISDSDFEWLGRDFDAISFEKGHTVQDEQKDIFTKKEYQQKLSARQVLEIVQQEFEEGYKEDWEDETE